MIASSIVMMGRKVLRPFLFISLATSLSAEPKSGNVYDEESGEFFPYAGRRLNDVEGYITRPENLEFSAYGGWKAAPRQAATGFFRVEKIDGRWWVIDPEGYLYFHKAVNSVQLFSGYTADDVYRDLPTFGMNGTGTFSDEEVLDSSLRQTTPLAHCPRFNFARAYANRERADGLPIAVFDDEFVTFCNTEAAYFEQFKDDPQVFGYFTDNELSWTFRGGLQSHIDVADPSDKNFQAAEAFLASVGKDTSDPITEEEEDAYAAIMAERYFSVVTTAIRAVDPNHMILGPRLNKSWNRIQAFHEAAGRHLDIVALNHYHRWGSRSNELENIAKWTDRPLLLSEFYAMEKIPGVFESGAGWKVEDETARALFYHHFATTQIAKPYMVGLHWFNFQDDAATSNDPGALRGIIDIDGDPYPELQAGMKYMNDRIYDYIQFVDAQGAADVTIPAEADAYFRGSENFGLANTLNVRESGTNFRRRSFLRFDVSSLQENVKSAKVQLFSTSREEKLTGAHRAEFVANNTWSETRINVENQPARSTLLSTFSHGDDIEIDVTDQVRSAISGSGKISLAVSTDTRDLTLEYATREHPDAYAHPKLVVTYYGSITSSEIVSYEDFEDGFVSWTNSGVDSILYEGGALAHQGTNAALLRDNTSSSRLVSSPLDLSAHSSVTVDFWYLTENFDAGDDFWLQISTDGGATYQTVMTWVHSTDFENDQFKQGTFTINDRTLTSNTVLRFKADAQNDFDRVYLDEIAVSVPGATWTQTQSFAEWLEANYPNVADTGFMDDGDGDGVPLYIEYAFNGDPEVPEVLNPLDVALDGNTTTFSFERNPNSIFDIEQTLEYSTDLSNWSDLTTGSSSSQEISFTEISSGIQEVKVTLDSDVRSFSRLRIQDKR